MSESGELAGKNAAHYDPAGKRSLVDINYDKKKLLYLVPQYFDNSRLDEPVSFYFRARDQINDVKVTFALGQTTKEKK